MGYPYPYFCLCAFLGPNRGLGAEKVTFNPLGLIWVVVNIMVPFWVPNIVRHLLFRVPKKGP